MNLYLIGYVSLWHINGAWGEAQSVSSMDGWRVPYNNKTLILNMVLDWEYTRVIENA